MDDRMRRATDHIAALIEEADAVRLARAQRAPGSAPRWGGLGVRRRMGRALVSIGALIEGPAECEACPDGMAAARS